MAGKWLCSCITPSLPAYACCAHPLVLVSNSVRETEDRGWLSVTKQSDCCDVLQRSVDACTAHCCRADCVLWLLPVLICRGTILLHLATGQ